MKFYTDYETILEETSIGYKPDKLEFKYNALEPYIDAETTDIHYNKHYKGYIKKLNELMEGRTPPILELLRNTDNFSDDPSKLKFNAGGYYNHSIFWKILTPGGKKPSKEFLDTINRNFESFDKFREKFIKQALAIEGSGWCWLVEYNSKLYIMDTKNQDNPLMDPDGGFNILLPCDCWEHSYYLKYHQDREKYLKNIFKVINWEAVSLNSSAALG